MLRDFNFLRRNSGRNEEIENVPTNPGQASEMHVYKDSSRAPLNSIDPNPSNSRSLHDVRSRIDGTPTKPPLRTPDRYNPASSVRIHRFGWPQRIESSVMPKETRDDMASLTRAGVLNATPRASRTVGRANSGYSEANSTQSTPTKSASKPPNSVLRSKTDANAGARAGNFAPLYKGMPSTSSGLATTVVNTVEVPHFDLKEDHSFWMDHNVQVLMRVRPLSSMERSIYGYNRCLKQESSQSITWIGQPETRFTFDHVACETVDQEMLFRMVGLPMVENCLSGYNSCMFAYGQTGSGKSYTMLGEIDDLEAKPSANRGMTPRIFEFLFARIQAEEEIRRDEKLKYHCKCSFLEIYNEQITDLLDPSSTNLLLREDIKKGVYVENLSEFEVHTVADILKILIQGSLNRKVAATNMNRESSRSHSVFTCVIECRWEKDATTNLRFARLNLVDLAGSERQKTSGAEGERLKEAASINKSLSTLGHVIMILVDVANGKPKHVPYRDSRLTFLLQDSLGGNSKTMVIANVSPSVCCAAETLNTLKFAQRAKLIQNNAVVNEDSTGDVILLQHQIRLLKEELYLLKRQKISRSLLFSSTSVEDTDEVPDNDFPEMTCEMNQKEVDDLPGYESNKQLKTLEITLAGALRREQMAETSLKKLQAEIEHLNCLVREREEDTRSTKMMLKFREDKIQRMELLLGASLPPDSYLREENKALSEENQLLHAKFEKNPEVTRFALENIRLLEQLKGFQEFYEDGEREILLDEVSKLRDKLLQVLEVDTKQQSDVTSEIHPQDAMHISKENDSLQLELKNTLGDLEECRHHLNSCLRENEKLRSEMHELHLITNELKSQPENGSTEANEELVSKEVDETHSRLMTNTAEEIMNLHLELDIIKIMLKEEQSSRSEIQQRVMCLNSDLQVAEEKLRLITTQYEDATCELKEVKSVLEALESQQILSINEMENLRKSKRHWMNLLSEKELEVTGLKQQLATKELRDHPPNHLENKRSTAQLKLDRMQCSLEKAKSLNMWYQSDRAIQASNEEEMEEVRRQVESETAEAIVCLQEELSALQQQVQASHLKETETNNNVMHLENVLQDLQLKLHLMTEENNHLQEEKVKKEEELRKMVEQWDLLTSEIEEILAVGYDALVDASDHLEFIFDSFPQRRVWISEKVVNLARIVSEKDLSIEELGRCLEDANNKRSEVECMLKSLKGAVMVMSEAHQKDSNEREEEILTLTSELRTKTSVIQKLENKTKLLEDHASKASVCATVAFVIVNRLSNIKTSNINALKQQENDLAELTEVNMRKDTLLDSQAAVLENAEKEIQFLRKGIAVLESNCAQLEQKLCEEKECTNIMQRELQDIEEIDIKRTKEELTKLKSGVSTLKSCVEMCSQYDGHGSNDLPFNDSLERQTVAETSRDALDLYLVEDNKTDGSESSFKLGKSTYDMEDRNSITCKDICKKDNSVILLRKEVEFALKSLQEVEAEMVKLHDEKELIEISNKQSQHSISSLTDQLLALLDNMDEFAKLFEFKIDVLNNQLQTLEQIVQETGSCWYQTKEFLESEVGKVKIIASQNLTKASCVFAKFEEAQNTMKEADIMINELLVANENMKLDIDRLKREEMILVRKLAIIMDELDSNKLLREKEECLTVELLSKDLESVIVLSKLEEISRQKDWAEKESFQYGTVIDKLLLESILSKIDSEFGKHVLVAEEDEASLLLRKLEEAERVRTDLSSRLKESDSIIREMDDTSKALLKETNKLQELELQYRDLQEDLRKKELLLENSLSNNSDLDHLNNKLKDDICALEILSIELRNDLEKKDADLSRMNCCEEESNSLKIEFGSLETELIVIRHELEEKKSEVELSICSIEASDVEIRSLKDKICSLENLNSSLKTDLEMKDAKLSESEHSRSVIMEELCSKTLNFQTSTKKLDEVKEEKDLLRSELDSQKKVSHEALVMLSSSIIKCIDSVKNIDNTGRRLFDVLCKDSSEIIEKVLSDMLATLEEVDMLMKDLQSLETNAMELMSDKITLQSELLRKEEILEGLQFDLSLLQETASSTKDWNDEIEAMEASLEALEHNLATKSCELDVVVAHSKVLEAQVQEKILTTSALKLDLEEKTESLKLLSNENIDLRKQVKETLAAKSLIEEESLERRKMNESLEMEFSEMSNELSQMNDRIVEVTAERDQLSTEVISLKENLEKAHFQVKENETIALEAQQIVQSSKILVKDKESEVKLLEKSVEELECTINVLENKVEIVKQEAERQRLQREELESELHALNYQMQNIKNVDADTRRHLDMKEKNLKQALVHIQTLEKDVMDKDAEISEFKSHISELNLHAEAQASEFKQKFTALEAMIHQVGPDGHFSHVTNSSTNRSEKIATKPRGSGSPFKCIGLGLTQQIKSEKDEELSAARHRIEELESLAAKRQKEVFALNIRVATADSMTHDVLRDLIQVKKDVNSCASLWDNQEVQEISGMTQLDNSELKAKGDEVAKLKQQLSDIKKEMQGLIDQRQGEMLAAQVALEKLRQQDQLCKMENEMLKKENVNNKKNLVELEMAMEINKVSGQQNLQQRIHHHAKIKDDNNALKIQNEDLAAKLRRSERIRARVKEEFVQFSEEEQLRNKLKNRERNPLSLSEPTNSRTDNNNSRTSRRHSQTQFLSALDR